MSALQQVAQRVADAYVADHAPAAVLLTGSVAVGEDDGYSDVDLIVYHERMPPRQALDATRDRLGGTPAQDFGPWSDETYAQSYTLDGVEVQVAHATVAKWERDIATIHERLETESPLQKALGGVVDGVALHGVDRVAEWQRQLRAYPDALARAMVERNLRIFPLWYVGDRLATRDAMLWRHRELVTGAERILAVLSGLNRVYFSPFQFKRLRRHVASFTLAPDRLAERLDALFALAPADAERELESLVAETITLVERHLPEVDTTGARRFLGQRQPTRQ